MIWSHRFSELLDRPFFWEKIQYFVTLIFQFGHVEILFELFDHLLFGTHIINFISECSQNLVVFNFETDTKIYRFLVK